MISNSMVVAGMVVAAKYFTTDVAFDFGCFILYFPYFTIGVTTDDILFFFVVFATFKNVVPSTRVNTTENINLS